MCFHASRWESLTQLNQHQLASSEPKRAKSWPDDQHGRRRGTAEGGNLLTQMCCSGHRSPRDRKTSKGKVNTSCVGG